MTRPMTRMVHLVLANAHLWTRWNSEVERARRHYAEQMTPAHRANPRDRSKERR